MFRLRLALSALLLPIALDAQARPIDWDSLARESQSVLSAYLRVNTTNPPGNEIAGARFLAEALAREDIESRIVESAPGRANLMARLHGDESP